MLLKSSDFVLHDLSVESVFEGCVDNNGDGDGDKREEALARDGGRGQTKEEDEDEYKLELVLRKWFAIEPSREMRAFVRDGVLVGESLSRPISSVSGCRCWIIVLSSFFFFVLLCHLCIKRLTMFVARTVEGRHLAAGQELLRLSERSIDAAQDRLVLRHALDDARQIQVDRSSIL
jgi:D123